MTISKINAPMIDLAFAIESSFSSPYLFIGMSDGTTDTLNLGVILVKPGTTNTTPAPTTISALDRYVDIGYIEDDQYVETHTL